VRSGPISKLVDKQSIDDFRQKGVTVLRGAFTDWVDVLRAGIDANLHDPDPNARIYKGENGNGRFFVDYCNWDRIAEYKNFIFNSNAAHIGAAMMNSQNVQLFHEHVLVKEASTDVPTPWHQDAPYYCVTGPKTVSLWVPLDTIERDTTLEFVSGSHLWGKHFRPQRFDGSALNEDDGLEEIPDINQTRDEYEILGLPDNPRCRRKSSTTPAKASIFSSVGRRWSALCAPRWIGLIAPIPQCYSEKWRSSDR
jgi:ectoine hydroxylase-related dioxygenase (phytanoyl-CoA dioxygenase family)